MTQEELKAKIVETKDKIEHKDLLLSNIQKTIEKKIKKDEEKRKKSVEEKIKLEITLQELERELEKRERETLTPIQTNVQSFLYYNKLIESDRGYTAKELEKFIQYVIKDIESRGFHILHMHLSAYGLQKQLEDTELPIKMIVPEMKLIICGRVYLYSKRPHMFLINPTSVIPYGSLLVQVYQTPQDISKG